MKYAIISDIHSNLEALEAVIKDCSKKGIDKYLCLGDIVGYGADPSACVKKVIDLNAQWVPGNHDHAVGGLTDITFFNSYAKSAVIWTRENLSDQELEFLKNEKFIKIIDDITLVHSSLDSPEMWKYILNEYDASKNIQLLENLICFIGHSHVPCIFQEKYNSKALLDFLDKISIKEKSIINVGSVGQPRDGDPRSSYVIYDTKTKSISFERVAYDVETAQRKIIDSGLPSILAARLSLGR